MNEVLLARATTSVISETCHFVGKPCMRLLLALETMPKEGQTARATTILTTLHNNSRPHTRHIHKVKPRSEVNLASAYQHDSAYDAMTPGVSVDAILPAFLQPSTLMDLVVLLALLRIAGVISSWLMKMYRRPRSELVIFVSWKVVLFRFPSLSFET